MFALIRRLLARLVKAINRITVPDDADVWIEPRRDYHLIVTPDTADSARGLGNAKRRAERLTGTPLTWGMADKGWVGRKAH